MMTKYLNRNIFYITFIFILIIWVLFSLQYLNIIDTSKLAIDKENGIWSIITGTFLHGSFGHLVGNTRGLVISIPVILWLYRKDFIKLTILGILIPSALSYYMNMPSIGISGLVFAFIAYPILRGLGSKDKVRFITALVLTLFYSSVLIGITPDAGNNINWMAHLFGFLSALLLAVIRYIRN